MTANGGSTSMSAWLVRQPLAALLALLCLAAYLPGVLALPPVDRTEVIWADSTRGMVERGAWTDPRYGEKVHAFRPIGTFWAQGVALTAAGDAHVRDIRVYRAPSLIAVTLAVLAFYWLAAPRVGRHAAALAAGLFAVAPLTVLVGTLAIADGLALLPATFAMLCLLRLYDPEDLDAHDLPRWLAPLFWAAMGVGMLVNALHTPILVAATLLALFVFDRDLSWLKRTRPSLGLPIAFALAAPWLYVRALQDGVPFSGLGLKELLAALGGAQDMKLRAFPGTFLAAALLGFLPGVALLPPALLALWRERQYRLPRFLLAWIVGYIAYLEFVSSKPGTYTVQVMFPAMALAVALLLSRPAAEGDAPPRHALIPWPPLAALFALVILAAPYAAMRELPHPLAAAAIALVAGLFVWSAAAGRRGELWTWGLRGIASLALFAIVLLGIVLPGIGTIWPAHQIAAAVEAACAPGARAAVTGFREPSAAFLFPNQFETADVVAIEARTLDRHETANGRSGLQIGCVTSFNTMRGCPLEFELRTLARTDKCKQKPSLACDQKRLDAARRSASRSCD